VKANLISPGSASFKVFLRLSWDPYEERLRGIQMRFSNHADVVFRAAQVQGMINENTVHQWAQLRADMEDLKHKGNSELEHCTPRLG
jgi:hypothetical protein